MVTGDWLEDATDQPELIVHVDGGQGLSSELIAAVGAVCDRAEDLGEGATVVVHASGVPESGWSAELTVAAVSKWERVLRRLERLPVPSVAVASGDCGGLALDALLATDYRIAATPARLMLPVQDGAVWPGMALYRIARQAPSAAAIRRAVLFGAALDSSEAAALNLVHDVAYDLSAALTTALTLLGGISGAELAVRRQLMFDAASVSFEDALGVHLAAVDRTLRRAAAPS